MKNELRFRLALRRAARLALITGKINLEGWRDVQSVLFNARRTTPDGVEVDLLEEIADDMVEHLKAEGKIAADATIEAIDWDSILAFMKEMLPMVLAFIQALLALFG